MRGRTSVHVGVMLALLAAALGGCSSDKGSTFAFGKAAEPPPINPTEFPTRYKTLVADFMRTYLSNPTKVKDAMIGTPVIKPVDGHPQYVTCVRYTARDSKNLYTAPETRLAIFLGNRLVQFLPDKPEVCAGLAYQRYPEVENMVP